MSAMSDLRAELNRLSKAELAHRVADHPAFLYSKHPPEQWKRSELIDALVGMTPDPEDPDPAGYGERLWGDE